MNPLGIPYGVPQSGVDLTPQWKGWFNQVKDVANAFLRGRFYRAVKITADYTPLEIDSAILADATVGDIDITLPDSRTVQSKRMTIKKLNAGNTVNVLATIDGAVNLAISTQYESHDLIPDPDTNAWWEC